MKNKTKYIKCNLLRVQGIYTIKQIGILKKELKDIKLVKEIHLSNSGSYPETRSHLITTEALKGYGYKPSISECIKEASQKY